MGAGNPEEMVLRVNTKKRSEPWVRRLEKMFRTPRVGALGLEL